MWYNDVMSDGRSITSKENGMHGGRPVATNTLLTQKFKEYLAKRIEKEKGTLIDAMLLEAKNGNVTAFVALLDRVQGKPAQAVEMTGKDGNPIVFMPLELIQKHALQVASNVVQGEVIDVTPKALNGSVEPHLE